MLSRRSFGFLTLSMALVVPYAASAAAPQLYAQQGTFAINPYLENWTCDSSTILGSDESCKNDSGSTVGFYRFMNADLVANPTDGNLYWYVTGDGRNGGPGGVCGRFDNLLVFRSVDSYNGRRGTDLELVNSCPEIQPKAGAWQTYSAFYDADFGSTSVNVIWTDTGNINTITEMEFRSGESANGWSSFNWRTLLRAEAPSAICSGIYYRIFAPVLTPDPTTDRKWIGTFTWRPHDSVGSGCTGSGTFPSSPPAPIYGVTPWYVDWNTNRVGIRFANEGWCEFPVGANFTTFDPTRTCATASLGNNRYALPDEFYELDRGERVQDLSDVNGTLYALRFDSRASRCGTDTQCIISHEPCIPAQDQVQAPSYTDYVNRRNSDFEGGGAFQIREFDPASLTFVGSWVDITEGSEAPAAFPMDSMDRTTDGFWNSDLIQYGNGGEISLYRGIKHNICDDSWDTFPMTTSGSGLFFQKLTTTF